MTLIKNDERLIDSESAYIYFSDPDRENGYRLLKFQYPPRITSDSRKATWKEQTNIPTQTEPVVLYASSSAREITVSFTYLFNNMPVVGGGGQWNVFTIQDQIRLCRSYFQQVKDIKNQRNLAIWAKFWGIGGQKWMTFRMSNIDVKYSETLIKPTRAMLSQTGGAARLDNAGEGGSRVDLSDVNDNVLSRFAFPFKTDVTMNLVTWTQGLPRWLPYRIALA